MSTIINFADDGYGTNAPSFFVDAGMTVTASLTANSDLFGGLFLGFESDLLGVDPVVYATASPDIDTLPNNGLVSLMTITLQQQAFSVSSISVEIFNGLPITQTYEISDGRGHTNTVTLTSNGTTGDSGLLVLPLVDPTALQITISAPSVTHWDFSIDNIEFNYSSNPAPILQNPAIPAAALANEADATTDSVLGILLAAEGQNNLAAFCFSLQALDLLIGNGLLQADPFDPNYTQAYSPTLVQIPTIQPDSTVTQQIANDENAAISDLSKAVADLQAVDVTLNRLNSAKQVGDQASTNLQNAALANWLALSSSSLAAAANDLNTLAHDMAGINLPSITLNEIVNFATNVESHGFSGLPSQELALFNLFGLSSTDEQNIVNELGSVNLSNVPTSLVSALQEASASLLTVAGVYSGSTLSATGINNIYEAVLQRPASQAEINNWLSVDSSSGDASVSSQIVSLSEAQFNIYPVVQIIKLAMGTLATPHQLGGWVPFVESAGIIQGSAQFNPLMDQMALEFVASDMFGNAYNNGIDVDPNSAPTAHEMQVLIQAALGKPATQNQINAWVNSGLTIDQVFVAFSLGDQYTNAQNDAIQHYLTSLADTAAGLQGSPIVGSTEASQSLVAHT